MTDNKTEELDIVKLSKEDYDAMQLKIKEYEQIKPEDFTEYGELIKEKEDLYTQLVPVWTRQGEQKQEMVNTILETIPEAEKESKQEIFNTMTTEQLDTIINSIPKEPVERGVPDEVTNGGQGSGRTPNKDPDALFEDPELQAQWEEAQKLPTSASRRENIITPTTKGSE